jgi:WD40 repeat protein/tRNA A-37 threonylcarbamoyl transferase component Bud32
MNESHNSPSAREDRLNEILAGYLEAVQAGQAADRPKLLADHPDLAPELAAFFADHDRMRQAAQPPSPPPSETPTTPPGEPAPADATLGTVRYFGDYELLEEIARGGMGVVYKARQVSLNRLVALKMILAGQLASEADVQRFHHEAEAAANLDHPNIVPIYEVGEHHGQHYFSMKLIDGGSLAPQVPQLVPDPKAAVPLLAMVARAVHHAHQRGILHRDLKPSNILLEWRAGRVNAPVPHVTDFGLAKRVEGDQGQTKTGAIVGTPSYMAPEQARGEKALSTAADVYSLGAMLYELLTGQPPFRAATPLDTVLQVLEREPARPRTLNAAIHRDLETICLKCLEKDPRRRFDSAAALADDLERWQRGEPILARPGTTGERLMKWARRKPAAAALLAVSAVAVMILAGVTSAFTFRLQAELAATEEQRDIAKDLQRQAEDGQQRAVELQQQTRQQEVRARHFWYGADLNLAQQSLEGGNGPRLVAALKRQIPKPGQDDLRGFEWWYLWRQSHTEKRTLTGHTRPVGSLEYSPDGKWLATAAGEEIRVWDPATGRTRCTISLSPDVATAVAFRPDGAALAVGVQGPNAKAKKALPQVQIWDLATGRRTNAFELGPGTIHALAFSPDGNNLTIVEVDDPLELLTQASSGYLRQIAKFIEKSAVMGLQVWSWDLSGARGKPVPLESTWRQIAHPFRLALAADRNTLMAAGMAYPSDWLAATLIRRDSGAMLKFETPVCWWDVPTGRLKKVHQGTFNPLWSGALLPDASLAAWTGPNKTVVLMDTQTGKEQVLPGVLAAQPASLAFAPVGKVLAFTSDEVTVQTWDVAGAREGTTLRGHDAPIQCLSFAPDGKTLAAGGRDHTVKIWDVARPAAPTVLLLKGAPPTPTLRPSDVVLKAKAPLFVLAQSGATLVTAQDNSIQAWDVATGRESVTLKDFVGPLLPPKFPGGVAQLVLQDRILSIALSPNGKLAAALWSSEVKVWDLVTGELRALIPLAGGKISLDAFAAFTSDGRSLIAGKRVWDTTTWQEGSQPTLESLESIKAISPDGKTFITTKVQWNYRPYKVENAVSLLALRDAESGTPRYTVQFPAQLLSSAAFTPDGRNLTVSFSEGPTRLFDVPSGQELAKVQGIGKGFSQDGRLAATADQEGTIWLWTVDTGAEHAVLQGHTKDVIGVAFSPDGGTVASSGLDGTVKLWDPLTGQERLTFRHEGRTPHQIVFTPDGQTLIVAWAGRQNPPNPGVVTLYRARRHDADAVPKP